MERNERQMRILELIAAKNIETQEQLADELRALNYNVTQATVSRDIKELGLVKSRYVAPDKDAVSDRIAQIFKSAVLSVDLASNIIVIKTLAGCANAVGVVVDKMSSVIGCVAGENAVLAICATSSDAEKAAEEFRKIFS